MATKTVLIDTGTTYTIPSDYASLVSIEALGSGGKSFTGSASVKAGGGGGAYAKTTTDPGLTPGAVINIQIGAGATNHGTSSAPTASDTWFFAAATCLYAQGASFATSGTAGAVGAAASCFPTTGAFSGGTATAGSTGGAGGGGAGKNGAGGAASTTTGGQGDSTHGGAGGTSTGTGAGSAGTEWSYQVYNTTVTSGTAGSGGGGGTGTAPTGGLYGAGAGASASVAENGAIGCIFLTYNVAVPVPRSPWPLWAPLLAQFVWDAWDRIISSGKSLVPTTIGLMRQSLTWKYRQRC